MFLCDLFNFFVLMFGFSAFTVITNTFCFTISSRICYPNIIAFIKTTLSILFRLQQSPYDTGVYNYLHENQIPFRFFLVLLIQFMSMIIDRALYLRRNMKGKIIFYLFSVIVVHIWQYHFIQKCNEKQLNAATWPPKLFYFVKCLYFLFSAYQIRCGYPKTVSGNFATNSSSLTHWRVFLLYDSQQSCVSID